MAVGVLMVVAPFRGRTTPKSTDLLLTLRDGLQSPWLKLVFAVVYLFRYVVNSLGYVYFVQN